MEAAPASDPGEASPDTDFDPNQPPEEESDSEAASEAAFAAEHGSDDPAEQVNTCLWTSTSDVHRGRSCTSCQCCTGGRPVHVTLLESVDSSTGQQTLSLHRLRSIVCGT